MIDFDWGGVTVETIKQAKKQFKDTQTVLLKFLNNPKRCTHDYNKRIGYVDDSGWEVMEVDDWNGCTKLIFVKANSKEIVSHLKYLKTLPYFDVCINENLCNIY